MSNNFCDYCSCDNCKYGSSATDFSHAKTANGFAIVVLNMMFAPLDEIEIQMVLVKKRIAFIVQN